MNKTLSLAMVVSALALVGCGGKKKETPLKGPKKEMSIPLAQASGDMKFFNEDVDAFELEGDGKSKNGESDNNTIAFAEQQAGGFKKIYFDFDKYSVRDDQKGALEADIEEAKSIVGKNEDLVVEGHACHSAGSKAYNLILSEHRAQEIAKELEQAGVNKSKVKIVGRGVEMPVVVGGDKNKQAPNRRVEIFSHHA